MVFSPVASRRINETDAVPPSTRSTPLQSTPSFCRSERMRLLVASALPPSGPAKATCPLSRAIVTAALAAHPPPVMMNSLAATLVPGAGKFCTRMTMSCTAMPEQRILGLLSSAKTDLVLNPGTYNMMCDRDGRRCGESLRMFPRQHRYDLILGKPAGVLKFLAINHDLARQRLGMTADHQ